MSKSILISIKPQYVEKILNREKIYEIRRTIPKEWKEYLEGKTSIKPAPSKWYIYCTKPKKWYVYSKCGVTSDELVWKTKDKVKMCDGFEFWGDDCETLNGRVVAEFTLKNISYWQPYWTPEVMHICDISEKSCVSIEDLMKYCGEEIIYALHIEDLKIYDKPKELSEFSSISKKMKGKESRFTSHLLQRPPQSWMFVERLEGE